MMTNEEAADKMIELADELAGSHLQASTIVGVVGCMTVAFDQEALDPIAQIAAQFGKVAMDIMTKALSDGEE